MKQNPFLLSVARKLSAEPCDTPPLVVGNTLYCPKMFDDDSDEPYQLERITGVDSCLWEYREEHPGYIVLDGSLIPQKHTPEDRLSLFASHER